MEDGVVQEVRSAGGEIYAITSEPQRLASQAQAEWELDFESIGDPHHEISEACRARGLLGVFVNTNTERFEKDPNSPYRHPKGYFQPGVLALTRKGRVLYRWRSRPTRENMGGATNRPTARHVFENISRALDDSSLGDPQVDAELDSNPELDSRGMPWLLFAPLLVANGWFLKPETFGQAVGGPSAQDRMKSAARRIPVFALGWVGALFVFPKVWVGVAFAAWLAWIVPRVRDISRQFQPDLPED